jgi:FkbM family methyltransferase
MNKALHNTVLPTDHGTMIVNRHEMRHAFGVAAMLADNGCYEPQEVGVLRDVIRHLPAHPVVLDIGANIGVHTLEFARATHALGGEVHAFEAQRQVFHMLAGNVAINSHFNVHCHHAAMGAQMGELQMPPIDYGVPTSFGSVELGSGRQHEAIGQHIDWSQTGERVRQITLDSLALPRVDLVKLDVEGMEVAVLEGGRETLQRCMPVVCVEFIKSGPRLRELLFELGYQVFVLNRLNFICVHPNRPLVGFTGLEELSPI